MEGGYLNEQASYPVRLGNQVSATFRASSDVYPLYYPRY